MFVRLWLERQKRLQINAAVEIVVPTASHAPKWLDQSVTTNHQKSSRESRAKDVVLRMRVVARNVIGRPRINTYPVLGLE
jgi:hypothetical protein